MLTITVVTKVSIVYVIKDVIKVSFVHLNMYSRKACLKQ